MKCSALALATLCLGLVASPVHAARIGLDARNGQGASSLLATGSEFDELRALLSGLGHELVPISSFDTTSLGDANIAALYVKQPFAQNFSPLDCTAPSSPCGFSSDEITGIQAFVGSGGGLVLQAEGGFGSDASECANCLSSMNTLAAAFGVSFASSATEPSSSGHRIVLFNNQPNSHPVTAGLPSDLLTGGFCVTFQRRLTIGAPAIDLTTQGGADDALAAVGTVAGDFGNVVLVSDTSAFTDADVGTHPNLVDCDNQLLAQNIVNFVVPIPEPGTLALVALGLVGLAARRRARSGALAVTACALGFGVGVPEPAHAACTGTGDECTKGQFGAPFEEPTLLGLPTTRRCVEDEHGDLRCKVTAGTLVALDDDRFLYWNALEGTENVETTIVAEFGYVTTNDQSRLLILAPGTDAPSWSKPSPEDGGAVSNPGGIGPCQGPQGPTPNEGADAALFCSDQKMLHDGRVLAAGGTDYYNDTCVDWNDTLPPGISPFPPGGAELEGIKNARIFDPATNEWTQTDSMDFGRWYPAAVTLPDGDIFIASGVTRLVKPVYPDNPELQSGKNVVQTETYDTACGTWSNNGALAERSLPLFPRLHLLPNGRVFFNAAGQAFNPFGQATDMILWNIVASYDPVTKTWADHAVAGVPGVTDPNAALPAAPGVGFRGSTFSVMLTLKPPYTQASFLTAGGVTSGIVNPSPGSYIATDLSRVDTMNLAGPVAVYSSTATGPLAAPRWYGYGTLLPNGQVLATSGGDRDEVWFPGSEHPVLDAELFTPTPCGPSVAGCWEEVDRQNRARTYHNSASLMRDGRVLVGGHAPITNSYLAHMDSPCAPPDPDPENCPAPNAAGRDPSFEIYSPWYVFRDDRPTISGVSTNSLTNGEPFTATVTTVPGTTLHSIVLMRRTATTHLVDGDQRAVELLVTGTNLLTGVRTLTVPSSNVLPPGKYVLFANVSTSDGVVPSTGVAMTVGADVVGTCVVE